MRTASRTGRGRRRMIFQATMLTGQILRAGETANDSVAHASWIEIQTLA